MNDEEGDLEEGEVGDTPKERDFLRPPPTGPRDRSATPRGPVPRPDQRKLSPRPAKRQNGESLQTPSLERTNGDRRASKEEASRMFVSEMVKAGYTFEDLAKEVGRPKPLIRIFKQLDLPVPVQYTSNNLDRPNGTAASHAAPAVAQVQQAIPVEEPRKASGTKRPAAAPAKPALDRGEYLARLQAAKNKKADNVAAAAAAPKPVDKPATPIHAPQPAQLPELNGHASSRPSPTAKTVDKTDLLRRKLEALRAQQAAKRNGTLPPSDPLAQSSPIPQPAQLPTVSRPVMSSPSQSGLGAGIGDIVGKASQVAVPEQPAPRPQTTLQPPPPLAPANTLFSPPPPTPTRSFSGLPGLFMLGTPAQASPTAPPQQSTSLPRPQPAPAPPPTIAQAQPSPLPITSRTFVQTPAASPAALTVPRKRPLASDFDDEPAKPAAVKRPFGQSRGNSEDEALIIEVSDDEDQDLEMDIEEDEGPFTNTGPQTKSFRTVGPLTNFPPKPNFQAQGSAPGTPGGALTPGGAAYEKKMKDIEELNRKIAEKEKAITNGKTPARAGVSPFPTTTSTAPTPALTSSSIASPNGQSTPRAANALLTMETSSMNGLVQAAAIPGEAANASSDRPMSAATILRQQERQTSRQELVGLTQNDLRDVNKAVEAAVAGPESVMSGGLPNASASAGGIKDGLSSEEGDFSDDSMADLYGVQDAHETEAEDPSVVDNGKIDFRATTASARGLEADVSQTANTAIGFPWPDKWEQDNSFLHSVNAVAEEALAPGESMRDDGDEEDLDETDDSDDLDKLIHKRVDQPLPQPDSHAEDSVEEGEVDDRESSSASSTNTNDYDPEPLESPNSAKRNEAGKDTRMATVSDVSTAESATKGEVLADDPARKLQPNAEERFEASDQVRGPLASAE